MMVGNVKLNIEHYSGKDEYTDGNIEDVLLEECKNNTQDELLKNSNDYAVLYHLSNIRHNLLEWYPFKKSDHLLEIGAGCGALTGLFSEKCDKVTCIELSKKRSMINAYRHNDRDNIEILIGNFQDIEPTIGKFDVITLIGVWEYSKLYISNVEDPFREMLKLARKHLKRNGKILIAIENKMGLKYWNGSPEDHTNKLYSGLNDYTSKERVRTFSKPEIEKMLFEEGLSDFAFYYPLPDYKLPDRIYSDEYLPQVGDIRIFGKEYASAHPCNFNEATVYDQITGDNQFAYFSNSFLICTGDRANQKFACYQRERRRKFQIATIIEQERNEFCVIKKPLHNESLSHLVVMNDNAKKWSKPFPNVEVVGGRMEKDIYCSSFIEGHPLDQELFRHRSKVDSFADSFKIMCEKYLFPDKSYLKKFIYTSQFKEVFGTQAPSDAFTTEYTNVDYILQNCKMGNDGKVYTFDFEWIFDFPIPYDYPIWRAAKIVYEQYAIYLKSQCSKKEFCERIGFDRNKQRIFESMEESFSEYVTGKRREEVYTNNYRKNLFTQEFRLY